MDPEEPGKERSFPWLAAAAVVALLSTAATWWIVASKSPQGAQWSGFELFTAQEPALYHTRDIASEAPLGPLDTARWSIPDDRSGIQELPVTDALTLTVDLGAPPTEVVPVPAVDVPKPVAVPESTAVAVTTPRSRYHVVGGCFLLKENAEGFTADLRARGFAASIVDQKGGLYRVAIGSYPDRALALEALAAVRKEQAPQAWLLVR